MIHIIYTTLLIATISNSLFSSKNRLNKSYHLYEILTVFGYCAFGFLVGKYDFYNTLDWLMIAAFVRFGLYSPIWSMIVYRRWDYLGNKAWTDKFLKWLIFEKMNQDKGAVLFLNFVSFAISIMMYLNIVLQ